MFKRYKEKEVKTLIRKLREEYDDVVRMIRGAYEEIKEENRNLRARLAQLEKEREGVADALVDAEKAGEEIKKDGRGGGGKTNRGSLRSFPSSAARFW